MPLASVKLAIEQKFFRNANQSFLNEEPCFTARLNWPLMDRRRTNQLLSLGRDVISKTVAVVTGHCVMGRHAERMRLPFNGFCRAFKSAEEEETATTFFVSAGLVSLTELYPIDVKCIASYNKLSNWFFRVG